MPSPNPNSTAGFRGFQEPNSGSTDFNAIAFIVTAMLARTAVCAVVKVMAVTNEGGVSPVGFVDIMSMVNQVDGNDNATPHGTIYKCPYFRLQGGANAIILDPQVGDLGIAIFTDRDISSVIENKGQANPASRRMHDMSDGLYVGGLLNGVPSQYVQFAEEGITIHSPVKVTLDAPDVAISTQRLVINATESVEVTTPTFTINGDVATVGALTNNGVSVGSTHKHSGVSTGVSNTGNPI